MSTVLLDTNAIIWFMARDRLERPALEAIAAAQSTGNVFISPISIWEAALALRKRYGQPDLGERDVAQWFRAVLKVPGFKLANLTRRIAFEAAQVPAILGRIAKRIPRYGRRNGAIRFAIAPNVAAC